MTIEQAGSVAFDHYEYKDLEVTVDADPKMISASGGNSSITASATWKYRAVYSDGTTGEWQNGSDTPTLSISGDSAFSLSGKTVSVGANSGTSARSTTVTASYEIGTLSDSDNVTIEQAYKTGYEYKDLDVTIDADPKTIAASGGTSTLTASATWKYREVYSDGTYGEWQSGSDTPSISMSGDSAFSRSGMTVSVGANTGESRSCVVTASYSIGTLSDSDPVTITQDKYVASDDFEWVDTSISLDAGGDAVKANFKSTSKSPEFDRPTYISYVEMDIDDDPDSNGYYSGWASFKAASSCANGDSGVITGKAGSDSDDLPFTVHKEEHTTTYMVVVTETSSGPYSYYDNIKFKAVLKTYVDDVETDSKDITSLTASDWSCSAGASASVSYGVLSSSYGTYTSWKHRDRASVTVYCKYTAPDGNEYTGSAVGTFYETYNVTITMEAESPSTIGNDSATTTRVRPVASCKVPYRVTVYYLTQSWSDHYSPITVPGQSLEFSIEAGQNSGVWSGDVCGFQFEHTCPSYFFADGSSSYYDSIGEGQSKDGKCFYYLR